MAWSTAGRNARATATAAMIDSVSLHDDDPGSAGTDNEWTGGGYSRQTPSWGSASNGVVGLSSALEFTGPALETAAYIGLWDDTTFLGSVARGSGDAAANAAGEYNVTALNIDATGTITS